MKLPESLEGASCDELVERWQIAPELAVRLLELEVRWAERFPGLGSLRIISGHRTVDEQLGLLEDPSSRAAPVHLSTHTTCPATGADLTLPMTADDGLKIELGFLVMASGLRWGGGSPLDQRGIPADWNHVDLGPRRS